MQGETTGIAGLDDITGGFPAHSLTMIVGPPGTGKTVLALQMATHVAQQGREVLFLSIFSEPHEKLIDHMTGFSFFRPEQIGQEIELLSLKSVLREGVEATLDLILRTVRRKREPLIILDGFRGLRNATGADAAQELMAALSSQLPYHRASCVVSSESNPYDAGQYPEQASADAIIALLSSRHGATSFRSLEVLKMRGHGFREGTHGMDITTDGIQVYPRLATCLPTEEPQLSGDRPLFGLPEFDRMLGGGLPELSTTVIFGGPGTGKTTFGLHYLLAGAANGESCLMVTFRDSRGNLLRKASELGLDLASAVDMGRVHILRTPPVEINPDRFAWRIRTMVEQQHVQRVVIDDVSELERSAGVVGSQSDYLAALNEFLWRSGATTVIMRDGLSMLPDMSSVTDLPVSIAQNRVILRRIEYRADLYRICSVLNMQSSNHDTNLREFTIGPGGITILDTSQTQPGVLAGIAREQPVHGA